jgi:DNA-binding LacI/PurR family transcriptional regulator
VKYRVIADDLRKGIRSGSIRPGDLLPSQNELIARYGVALGTVRRAINHLESQGWLRAKQGRGLFAVVPAGISVSTDRDRPHTVGFAVIGPFAPFNPLSQIVLHTAMAVLQPAMMEVSYGVFSPDDPSFEQRFGRFLDRVKSLILYQYITPRVLEIVREHGVRTVLVGRGYMDNVTSQMLDGMCMVETDADTAGYTTVGALAMAGHKRLVFLHEYDSEYYQAVLRAFRRGCKDYNVQGEAIRVLPQRGTELDAARKLAREGGPTGIVVVGEMYACTLIADLRELGVGVPRDKSVIAIGGMPRNALAEPELTRVNTDLQRIAHEAASLLMTDSAAVIHKALPVRFERGATLAPRHGGANPQRERRAIDQEAIAT